MMRMSSLRNIPVICRDRQIGLLQNICLDAAQKRIVALIISCGIRGKRIALPSNVISMADGFILIQDTEKYQRSFDHKPCCLIRDTTGLLTGKVTDYAISKKTWQIIAVEMMLGYNLSQINRRIWIYDYSRLDEGKNELIVPSYLGKGLIMYEEGEENANLNHERYCSRKPTGPYHGRRIDDDASRKTNETCIGQERTCAGQTSG